MLSGIGPQWLWLTAGILLLAAETMAPGVFLFWIGLAAMATGLVLFVMSPSFMIQLVLFAMLALAAVAVGRTLQLRSRGEASDTPFLNERGRSLVGKSFPLEAAIVNGAGSVRIGDTVWRVAGADAPAGARVTVKGVDGGTLLVEPA